MAEYISQMVQEKLGKKLVYNGKELFDEDGDV